MFVFFTQEITLTKQVGEPLGIRINGGVDGKRVNPDDPEDDGIFVTEVRSKRKTKERKNEKCFV